MWKFLLLTAGAAAAFQLAKKYNITLDDVKGFVAPLLSKYVTA
ncbi:MAG: hypothetical protein K0Q95_3301 [Bacteroidota bacterium]|jgi:hypothetical protein|nr:hypothetical protein [Bacteroidota bacterium]